VYILKSIHDNSLYLGCTSNLEKRVAEHNSNLSEYSKKHSPWKLIYCECFVSKADAFAREKALKVNKQGFRRLKERLQNSLNM
jgi:putative endonuclease